MRFQARRRASQAEPSVPVEALPDAADTPVDLHMIGWRQWSIATRLPLSLALLLSAVSGTITLAAFLKVRSSVQVAASERLDRAGQQLADTLATSQRQRLVQLQALVERSRVAGYLRTRTPESAVPVTAAFTAYLGNSVRTASMEVWTADRRRVLAVGAPFSETLELLPVDRAGPGAPQSVVGPYGRDGNTTTYSLSTVVKAEDGLLGYLVERRRLSSSTTAIKLLAGLIGSDARLLIGNASGGLWTSLDTAERSDLTRPAEAGLLQYQHGDGPAMLARAVPIADTPWAVMVAFPRDPVMAPVRQFLIEATVTSILLSAAGVAAGWLLSRRLTIPLRAVTEGAEAIAESRTAPRLMLSRRDEVGRLATSFNLMADQVEASRRRLEWLVEDLEGRVAERTAALETANRDLEAFTYSVSHDLRAPLRAIDGFAQILVADHAAELTPAARGHLDVISGRTRHMGQLIDDLLAFSRLGHQLVTPTRIDMTALAKTVADEAQQAESGRDVTIVVRPLRPALGERSLIKQVLTNYVLNAVKFTRTRPSARIEIGEVEGPGEHIYYVKDNGVGFDMAYADKLFGVFQRLHRAEDFEGTGVGLAIVQRIVARHRGRVWAQAAANEGATFFFSLPHEESDA
jgi:signal transduction histidine kinase